MTYWHVGDCVIDFTVVGEMSSVPGAVNVGLMLEIDEYVINIVDR
jgi:hypothetical protein